ncbi:MAG: hypothetical protein EI684_00340 [Candidatus Viridilinea halotolerans]|uniref:Class I SAM-dependent methyltransferase n=1 Tax=Candidatus Viridilinea halotolerans TaxID=2491704 RepID=A0A426UC41_9CHLR|nr:MAG: hypothetical protein EI684_00340 [Candidatus Viridilinea halotolerans]
MKPTDVGVEFGSGRSTAWFAARLASLCSIESNALWYERVKKELTQSGLIAKVDYRLCEDHLDYVKQIETFQNETIDFCLVDGAVRDQCALHMLQKIKRGGLLVIDNVNWFLPNDSTRSPDSRRTATGCTNQIWEEVWQQLKNWRKIWTSNGISDTGIWFKP